MISKLLLYSVLVIPLCAQVPAPAPASSPAVRILLRTETPEGTPALDMAAITGSLKSFATDEGFIPPAPDGDGWVLGIELNTRKEPNGMLAGSGAIRLSRVKHGKITPDDMKESVALVVAWKSEILGKALGDELVRQGQDLLAKAEVISAPLVSHSIPKPPPSMNVGNPSKPHRFEFSQVKIREQPVQPPYPLEAKQQHIQGTVVVELAVDPTGVPVSATAIEGPDPLLPYACSWILQWRFDPLTLNGRPEYGRFKINMKFQLD